MLHWSLMKILRTKKAMPLKKQIPHFHRLKQRSVYQSLDLQIIELQKFSIMNETCEYRQCQRHLQTYSGTHQGVKWWRHPYKLYRSEPRPMTPGRIISNIIRKYTRIGNRDLVLQLVLGHCKSGCNQGLLRLTPSPQLWTFRRSAPTAKTKKWKICQAEILHLLHRNIPRLHLSKWKRMICAGSTLRFLRTPP